MSADNCSSDCALPPCLHQSAGMMVDVRPWPKAFRPPPPPKQQQTEQQQTDGSDPPEQAQQAQQPRCFYFMGLSKKKVCERAGARQAARIARSCAGDSQPVRHGATARGSCASRDQSQPALEPRLPCSCLQCSLQAQAYNAFSSALVIPQSKVDLTAPVNEFAHKASCASLTVLLLDQAVLALCCSTSWKVGWLIEWCVQVQSARLHR